MHELGYNFFNIGKLTYAEIENLVDAWNRKQKKQENAYKKSSKKH